MNNYQARVCKSVFQYFDLIQGNDHLENYNFRKNLSDQCLLEPLENIMLNNFTDKIDLLKNVTLQFIRRNSSLRKKLQCN